MNLTFNQWLLELKRQRINNILSIFDNELTKSLSDLSNTYFDTIISKEKYESLTKKWYGKA